MAKTRRMVRSSWGVPRRMAPWRSMSRREEDDVPWRMLSTVGSRAPVLGAVVAEWLTALTMRTRSPYRGTSALYMADMARVKSVRRASRSTQRGGWEEGSCPVAVGAMMGGERCGGGGLASERGWCR